MKKSRGSKGKQIIKEEKSNSLTNFTNNVLGFGWQGSGSQLSLPATIEKNNSYFLISNYQSVLAYFYKTHGIVQVLIDQPVEDCFKNGIIIKSTQLSPEQIQDVQDYLLEYDIITTIKNVAKWSRLYGGAGLVINTVGKANKPLNINVLGPDVPLEFYDADLWELQNRSSVIYGEPKPYIPETYNQQHYFFYGHEIHNSRVIRVLGKRAPSFIRPALRGWGFSEVEKLIRSINQYIKAQDVLFELLDEAKLDIYKIQGFNNALINSSTAIAQRITQANLLKNYKNSLAIDSEDDYVQKQINFMGLAEMSKEIRYGIAADLKIPVSKLFGQPASGLGDDESAIENYNSMIESEIRGKFNYVIIQVLQLICQKLFGFIPDLRIEYYPLRILSAEEEEKVKDAQLNRLLSLYDRQIINAQTVIQHANMANLLDSEIQDEPADEFPHLNNPTPDLKEKVEKSKKKK